MKDRSRPASSFKDLVVWQKAHQWVLEVYRFTREFPSEEKYGLSSQLRRAAVSVPANIVEGFRRRGKSDKSRFFNMAQSSLAEAEYYLILADDLGYGRSSGLAEYVQEVERLLNAYTASIRRDARNERSS